MHFDGIEDGMGLIVCRMEYEGEVVVEEKNKAEMSWCIYRAQPRIGVNKPTLS